MSKAQPAISNRKSSFSAAALVRSRNTLTFRLHPKQLVALRSKATEILFGGANREKRPVLSWSGWGQLRGWLTPRFRTIQVCPKDPASPQRQAERAVNRTDRSGC